MLAKLRLILGTTVTFVAMAIATLAAPFGSITEVQTVQIEEREEEQAETAVLGAAQRAHTLSAYMPRDEVEARVREYFYDTPIMVDIAWCESRFRQTALDGTILRGKVNNSDLGVMQVNEYYHGDTAERLGLDLYTLEGNMRYARNLYEREGVQPWSSSRPCWGGSAHLASL